MPAEPGRFDDSKLRSILEDCFLAQEEGRQVDLGSLCGDDEELEREVRKLMGGTPDALVRAATVSVSSVDSSEPKLQHHRVLGDFELEEEIGRGGMGTVYRARQRSLGRHVAVKVLTPGIWADPLTRLRFAREAELTAALDHPNIGAVYDVGEEGSVSFMAMKLLSGPSLDQLEGSLEPRDVAYIGACIAKALHAAHLEGIVHRDVKPANILLDNGVPHIVDFGLARTLGEARLTQPNVVPGTLPYMAPEEFSGSDVPPTPAVDVYALGATLYELLSGRRAFLASDSKSLIRIILLEDPEPLGLPRAVRDLDVIVRRALEKEPKRRFESAADMAADLERFIEGRSIRSKAPTLLGRLEKVVRRNPVASAVATVAALVILATGGLAVKQAVDREDVIARERASLDKALAEYDLKGAESSLGRLRELEPVGAFVAEQATRHESEVAFEELLDIVLDRRTGIVVSQLEDALERASGKLASPREPARLLAIALGHYLLGDDAAFQDWSARAQAAGASTSSLAALARLRGATGNDESPRGRSADVRAAEPETVALEAAIEATALRLAGIPLDLQMAALEPAIEAAATERLSRQTSARTFFTEAIALVAAGRSSEAEPLLQVLTSTPEPARIFVRTLALVRLEMGDAEGAVAALARIPEEQRTVPEALLEIDVALRQQDQATARSLVDAARERWPNDVELLSRDALLTGVVEGNLDAGLDILREGQSLDSADAHARAILASAGHELGFYLLKADRGFQGFESEELPLRALANSIEEALRGAPSSRPASRSRWVAARACIEAGELRRALALLRSSFEGLPYEPGPRVDFVVVTRMLDEADTSTPEEKAALKLLALREVRGLVEDADQGRVTLNDEDWLAVVYTGLQFSMAVDDIEGTAAFADRYAEIMQSAEVDAFAEQQREARDRLLPEPDLD